MSHCTILISSWWEVRGLKMVHVLVSSSECWAINSKCDANANRFFFFNSFILATHEAPTLCSALPLEIADLQTRLNRGGLSACPIRIVLLSFLPSQTRQKDNKSTQMIFHELSPDAAGVNPPVLLSNVFTLSSLFFFYQLKFLVNPLFFRVRLGLVVVLII